MISKVRTLLFLLLLAPSVCFAQIQITDVLYDAPGVDTGHEWIKLNTTEAVDLRGFTLFEGGVHHALKVVQGTSTLAAGESAIIVTDPEQYLVDHRNYKGLLFKSSFSLSNAGETFSITDKSKHVVTSYSYTAPPALKPAPKTTTGAAKKSIAATSTKVPVVAGTSTTAASTTPSNSPSNALYWSLGGLVVVIGIGLVGIFLARPQNVTVEETSSFEEEFQIEE